MMSPMMSNRAFILAVFAFLFLFFVPCSAVSPPLFDGNPTRLEYWIVTVTGYILTKSIGIAHDDDGNEIVDHQAQVGLALMLVTPRVGEFLGSVLSHLNTWLTVQQRLRGRYLSNAIKNEYLLKLQHARQTSDVTSYNDYFLGLCSVLAADDISEYTKVVFYTAGLTPTIANAVMTYEPTTLAIAMEKALWQASITSTRTEYPARPKEMDVKQPKVKATATVSASGSAKKGLALFTLRKDDVLARKENVWAQTFTEKDDTPLLACHDTMSSHTFMSTAIAEWLGLVPEVVPDDTLYTLNGPITLNRIVKMPLRHTSTCIGGIWITFYLHDRIPWLDIVFKTTDYLMWNREGGRILRAQSAAMAKDAQEQVENMGPIIDDAVSKAIISDAQEGKVLGMKTVRAHLERGPSEPLPTSTLPAPAAQLVAANSPTKPKPSRGRGTRRPGRIIPRGGPSRGDDPFITKGPIDDPITLEDLEFRPDPKMVEELQELLATEIPRELWGWKDYYAHKAKKVKPPTPPPRYDPSGAESGAEVT